MSHRRIRVVNTRDSYHAREWDFGASKAVVAADQVFLVGATGLTLDNTGFVGEGDPAAQAEQAMENLRILLEEAGGGLEDICLVNNYTKRHADRALVYPVIARHLHAVNPVSTGLVVKDFAQPYIDFEIDAWAVLPRDRERGHERFRLTNAKGGFLMPTLDYPNARVIRANDHIFLQGQTGLSLDGRDFDGAGDPARQVEVAMQNVKTLLADAGATIDDVCKVTTYLTDPAHREQIDAMLADHFEGVRPVVTGIHVNDLARPELDFEIDVFAIPSSEGSEHQRFQVPQVDGDSAWPQSHAVRAGRFLFLQGQSGLRLDGSGLTGAGDVTAQAEQAMENVRTLLEEMGGRMEEICKITTFVIDQAARLDVYPVFGRHLSGVNPASTGLVVEALWRPDLEVAIDAFAVIE